MIYKKLVLEGKQKLYFSSDFHYGHKNICRGTTGWDLNQHGGHNSVRDFETIDDMNLEILNGINSTVLSEDWLVFLGDWSFGGEENIKKFREQINCQNIIFILGNHDSHIVNKEKYRNLFSSVHSYLELSVSSGELGKITYNLLHFPMSIWNKGHHNRIHLHGHCHSSYQGLGKILDVGIDNAIKVLGSYRPFSQHEVIDLLKDKSFVQKSHHNPKTN
jgi:calcineurin-like phosphoesterase family protein